MRGKNKTAKFFHGATSVMAFRCHAVKVDLSVRKRETNVIMSCLRANQSVSFAQGIFSPILISVIPEKA